MRVSLQGGAMDGAVLDVIAPEPDADGMVTLPDRLVVHPAPQRARLDYRVATVGEDGDGCTLVQLSNTGKPVYRFVGEL